MKTKALFTAITERRGSMSYTRMRPHVEKIQNSLMVGQAVDHKRIGIKRLSEIAENYSYEQQYQLNLWLSKHPVADKASIETFIKGLTNA